MPTIEEYIRYRKLRDGIDEFDVNKRVDNIGSIISYVVDYFQKYVDPEKRDLQYEKRKAWCEKYKKQISSYPLDLAEWLVNVYLEYGKQIDPRVKFIYRQDNQFLLSYTDSDFAGLTKIFYDRYIKDLPFIKGKQELISRVFKAELLRRGKEEVSYDNLRPLGGKINEWIKNTFDEYGVPLYSFACSYLAEFFDETHKLSYDRINEESYYVKSYNYKGSNNLFGINEIYSEIEDMPFLTGRKLELEVLFMYVWLTEINGDEENYWDEYIAEKPERAEIVND